MDPETSVFVIFGPMPVIVIGADTDNGQAILRGLWHPEREIRAFVTDEEAGSALKSAGFKVATGDVSDESHVEAAAMRCFSAVLITEAADDNRERSFAENPQDVLLGWARAVESSGVTRVIWVTSGVPPVTNVPETVSVDPRTPDLADRVVALDDAQPIDADS